MIYLEYLFDEIDYNLHRMLFDEIDYSLIKVFWVAVSSATVMLLPPHREQ
jgi:hypothetical protein